MRSKFVIYVLFLSFVFSCVEGGNQQEVKKELIKDDFISLYDKYLRIMKEKEFSLEINGPCDDALEDEEHQSAIGYVETINTSDSSLVIEFKFKNACCQEFLGDYVCMNDTLFFEYEQINDVMCSCMCWYRYKLILNNFKEKIDSVIIKPLVLKGNEI